MHFKSGCLSISPNNHKVAFDFTQDVCKLWTFSIDDSWPRAIVTLQWVFFNRGEETRCFYQAQDLGQLVDEVNDPLVRRLFENLI
jgi:hypothetical protein